VQRSPPHQVGACGAARPCTLLLFRSPPVGAPLPEDCDAALRFCGCSRSPAAVATVVAFIAFVVAVEAFLVVTVVAFFVVAAFFVVVVEAFFVVLVVALFVVVVETFELIGIPMDSYRFL
jgi:hypothetical protein